MVVAFIGGDIASLRRGLPPIGVPLALVRKAFPRIGDAVALRGQPLRLVWVQFCLGPLDRCLVAILTRDGSLRGGRAAVGPLVRS